MFLDGSNQEDDQPVAAASVETEAPVASASPSPGSTGSQGLPTELIGGPLPNRAPSNFPPAGGPEALPFGYPRGPLPEPENTSGQLGDDVPREVQEAGFHWGAFLLSTYWAKEHGINGLATLQGALISIWVVSGIFARMGIPGAFIIRLLCIIAVPALSIYFGAIGYREGWRYKRYPGGLKEFFEDQREWTRRGFIIAPLCIVAIVGLLYFIFWIIEASAPGGYFTRGDTSDTPPPAATSAPPSGYVPPPPAPSYGGSGAVAPPPTPVPSNSPAPAYQGQTPGSYPTQAPSQPQAGSSTYQQQPGASTYQQQPPAGGVGSPNDGSVPAPSGQPNDSGASGAPTPPDQQPTNGDNASPSPSAPPPSNPAPGFGGAAGSSPNGDRQPVPGSESNGSQ